MFNQNHFIMKTEMKKAVERIKAMFREFNGATLIGVRRYENRNHEVANHVVNANCSYANACATSKQILESLTSEDFAKIEKIYKVNNTAGIQYATNKGAEKYLNEGILPKEGTKARETALNGVKVTKDLATIRDEMAEKYDLDNREVTPQMIAQKEAYLPITKSMKLCLETGNIHIHAYAFAKEVIEAGEYAESNPRPETLQKNAIERYCKEHKTRINSKGKEVSAELPATRYRNFIVTEGNLAEVIAEGTEIRVA